jgi:hypothetical protein
MPILQYLMNQNVHQSSETFARGRFIRTSSTLSSSFTFYTSGASYFHFPCLHLNY